MEHEIGEKRSKINMESLTFEPLPQYLAFKHCKNGIFKVIFYIEHLGARGWDLYVGGAYK